MDRGEVPKMSGKDPRAGGRPPPPTRFLIDGGVFEKAGVNFSKVFG